MHKRDQTYSHYAAKKFKKEKDRKKKSKSAALRMKE